MKRCFLLFLIFLFLPLTLWASEHGQAESTVKGADTEVIYPGLSELGERAAALNDFVVNSEEGLVQLSDLEKEKEVYTEVSERLLKLKEDIKPLGPPDDWYVDRLNHYTNQYLSIRKNVDDLLQNLSSRQEEVESIREGANTNSEFWAGWEKELKKQELKIPKQTHSDVKEGLARLEGHVKKSSNEVLSLQEKSSSLLAEIKAIGEVFTQALDKIRKATFRKNSYSFFSVKFYGQFDSKLRAQANDGIKAALTFDKDYVEDNSWQLGLLFSLFIAIACLILRYRQALQKTSEWDFVLHHPCAAAAFTSVLIFWVWLPAPPVLYRFGVFLLAVTSAATLAFPLLENTRQRRVLLFAALVVLLTSLFQLVDLPQPLFRLYISLLTIILIPILVRQIYWSRKDRKRGEGRFFRSVLRLAIVVLSVSFIGQAFGYVNFSAWLILATFQTGMVILFAKMVQMLVFGSIELGTHVLSQHDFIYFKRFGHELAERTKKISKFIIGVVSVFYLLPIWRVFPTSEEAWIYLAKVNVPIGEMSLSLQMLVSASVALYLAMQISWIVQGVTETQFLERRAADRGVRDAVKKLIHYAVVLSGFLMAISFLGFSLQNLVVILGAFGIGIGFGLQDIVNNFLSGLILLFERPIKVGDGVLIDGEYGTVKRIGMRSTVVENLDEAELIVPNSQMISQKVTNWTLSNRRVRLVVPIGVAYGSDLEKVLEILKEAGSDHAEVLDDPAPSPLFVEFGGSSLDFELRVWISNVDERPRIKNELLLYLDRRFREEEIEIPFPQTDLHLRSVAAGISLGQSTDKEE